MNKKDRLTLLNECLNQIKSATADDISRYEAAYKKNCSSYFKEGKICIMSLFIIIPGSTL